MADRIDASPAGPTRELRVLAGRQVLMPLAGELAQALDDDRTSRHVDAEGERLGGENHLDQALGEAALDRLLERWHHPGVVRRARRWLETVPADRRLPPLRAIPRLDALLGPDSYGEIAYEIASPARGLILEILARAGVWPHDLATVR